MDLSVEQLFQEAAMFLTAVLPVDAVFIEIQAEEQSARVVVPNAFQNHDFEGVLSALALDEDGTIEDESWGPDRRIFGYGFDFGSIHLRIVAVLSSVTERKILETPLAVAGNQLAIMSDRAIFRQRHAFPSPEPGQLEKSLLAAQSRIESMLTAGEVGTWDFDLVNDVVWGDRNLAKIFGVSPEVAIEGAPLSIYLNAIHPDDLPAVRASIEQSIGSEDHFYAEYRIVRNGSDERWVIARGRIDRNITRQAVRLPGVVVDVTAQRTAEISLRATLARWKLALESAELGAWNIQASTNTLQTDDRFRLIFHGSTDEISLDEAFAAIHVDDRQRVRDAVEAAMNPLNPRPYSEEYRVLHPNGRMIWVSGKGGVNFEGSGSGRRLNSFDGTVADITERKLREDSLRDLASRLSEADRRKDEFIATLAHELRNPLAPIRTGLEVMKMSGNDPVLMEKVRAMMETQAQQLVRLIDDLLDVSRITSGKIDLRKTRMELAAAVESAVEAVRPFIEERGHRLSLQLNDEPIILIADSARVAQIISNLLTNSARYTERGGHVSLKVEKGNNEVAISIADTGIGIEPAMLENIFEMFTQAGRALEMSHGGLGIGLTLVRRLTELHGGNVEARSEGEGMGSEFIVTLPIEPATGLEGEVAASLKSPVRRKKIIVADDNTAAADTLAMVLRLQGHDVKVVNDGDQCIKEAKSSPPHLILMDLGMPRMNGFEAANHIRSHSWGQGIQLIALTGWGQDSDKEGTSLAGFDHHLVKPVEPAELIEIIRDLN